jgi:ankyrin repeat protein
MKKILLSVMISALSSYVVADFNNLHAYATIDTDGSLVQSEINRNPEQLAELNDTEPSTVNDAPIHIAVKAQNLAVVKEMAKIKEYIDVKNSYGQTALMIALREGFSDIAAELRSAGASLDAIDSQGNKIDAYARVGNISIDELENYRSSRDVISTNQGSRRSTETENVENNEYQERPMLTLQQVNRIDEIEQTINSILDLLNEKDEAIEGLSNDSDYLLGELSTASADIESLKSNLQRQAQVLIPMVRENLQMINSINGQIRQMENLVEDLSNEESNVVEMSESIKESIQSEIDAIALKQIELEEKYAEMEELRERVNEQENTQSQRNTQPTVQTSSGFPDLPTVTNVPTFDEPSIIDQLMNNLMYILAGIGALFAVFYILFKDKFKKALTKKKEEKSESNEQKSDENNEFNDLPSEKEIGQEENILDDFDLDNDDLEYNNENVDNDDDDESVLFGDDDDDSNSDEDDDIESLIKNQ